MVSSWSVYSAAIDDMRDEEFLNDCFAEVVDDSLTQGPGFLNYLLDDIVEFEEGAEVEGTDRSPLPYRDEGTDRAIDLTVGDKSKIVGFESKRQDALHENQLQDELEKLRYNSEGREALLVAVTEDLREPELIPQLPDEVRWTSWFHLAQRTFKADYLEGWNPTTERAKKMFREFGYSEFDGIDPEEFRVSVWELWKQTATQVEEVEAGRRWPYNMLKGPAGTSTGYKPVDPDWMILTFNSSNKTPEKPRYALLSNKHTQELWVGVATKPWRNEELTETYLQNAEEIADSVVEKDLEVIQFPLNWLVGRKSLPEGHKKNVRASQLSDRDDLVDAFTDRKGMEKDGANWFFLGYQVDLENPLEETTEKLPILQNIFGDETEPSLKYFFGDSGEV